MPPMVSGGALIVPVGLINQLAGRTVTAPGTFAQEKKRVEILAMQAVMATEKRLGYVPQDVSQDNCGYDIESQTAEGKLRLLEVKGRTQGAKDVIVTRNEALVALQNPERFILVLVEVPVGETITPDDCKVRYVLTPFEEGPDWSDKAAIKDWRKLWEAGQAMGNFARI